MPVIDTVCPEKGCNKPTKAWAGGLSSTERWNRDSACTEHRDKYDKIYQEFAEKCRLMGIPVG